ncbi:unnamed protein product [Vitrella brassicaformis CCMP3155]|uniref:Malic enzyme n=2 Tax=Vitrella brassicaformis TaxID=1169539 RepID=A0A0G4GY29_VITBC|nr:unnamed protein product [Vitrella brassicaformis CCMP3155]|eukprot:CEM35928.1 unnamed protein product [Vitrella brassicaformis CCMP3155]
MMRVFPCVILILYVIARDTGGLKPPQHGHQLEADRRNATADVGPSRSSHAMVTMSSSALNVLRDPIASKGLSFTATERDRLDLNGYLPPAIETMDQQIIRLMDGYERQTSDFDRYLYLESIHDRSEVLYFRLLVENVVDMMPIVYTPTVGIACQNFSRIYRQPRGIFLSTSLRGRFYEVLRQWPQKNVEIIVVTDGSRILGLGDLGANGMGIAIGKLSLYVAAAGIHPSKVLPIMLDVGTNNEQLLMDPLYIGEKHPRLQGDAYDAIVDEFVSAVRRRWPAALVQWEDFSNDHAFPILSKYRDELLSFNDDIQGTGTVILAGLLGAMRITQSEWANQTIVFYGAGAAAVGIADMILEDMVDKGMSHSEAKDKFWLVDSKGLVTTQRSGAMQSHKLRFARDDPPLPTLLEVVKAARPTMLLGLSGKGGAFTEKIIKAMRSQCKSPIIFALSNPTSKSECTAEEAYKWGGSSTIFASGSPFAPVPIGPLGIGGTQVPGQGNNLYVFPGVGLGAISAKLRTIPDSVFALAARTLASMVTDDELAHGTVYPSLTGIRNISMHIAAAIVQQGVDTGASRVRVDTGGDDGDDKYREYVDRRMWYPDFAVSGAASRVGGGPSIIVAVGWLFLVGVHFIVFTGRSALRLLIFAENPFI